MIEDKQESKRARFIAGAVCTGCGELDRIIVKELDGVLFRECVSCGFSEKRPEGVESPSPDLKGRLERPPSTQVKAVKLDLINLNKK